MQQSKYNENVKTSPVKCTYFQNASFTILHTTPAVIFN